MSLSTGVRSVDWGQNWNWPKGTSRSNQGSQKEETTAEWTEEPEEYLEKDDRPVTGSPKASDRDQSLPVRTRSKDSTPYSSTPIAASRRTRKQQHQHQHQHQSNRHTAPRTMSRPASANANAPYADAHDFGNDGDGEAPDRGMTESSSGFATSDNEFTDEPERYAQQSNARSRDFAYGGKYVPEAEQEPEASTSQSRPTGKTHRLKRPIRKSSIKALIPATSARKSSGTSIKQKLFIAFLTILGLFLLGTVIVLSTIQRYFRIEDWAYLDESEIGGWSEGGGNGEIPALKELVMGNATSVNRTTGWEDDDEEDVWGPNGEGTGGYWMKQSWDGTVRDTEDWSRLYNVSLR